jgi:hypothetical protein
MRGLGSTSVRPQGRVGSGSIIFFIDCRVSCRRFGNRARVFREERIMSPLESFNRGDYVDGIQV